VVAGLKAEVYGIPELRVKEANDGSADLYKHPLAGPDSPSGNGCGDAIGGDEEHAGETATPDGQTAGTGRRRATYNS
jgi:hypothetical protein